MIVLSRLQKEQALRAAGIAMRPYPTAPADSGNVEDQRAADLALLQAGTAWEHELERLYLQLVARQEDAVPSEAALAFAELCKLEGLPAALEQLNRRVTHRYTAVYRLEGELLRNVALADKAGETRPEYLMEVPIGTSFCQFVLRDGLFLTSNSGNDDRLNEHPYKGVMVAYHGVPVPGENGALLGTLCHFDVQEQPLSDAEFAHLKAIAQVIPPYLK